MLVKEKVEGNAVQFPQESAHENGIRKQKSLNNAL